jgi:predicted solute-binding protein
LELRNGIRAQLRENFSLDDDARLVIGNDALTTADEHRAVYPWVFDLGREWYIWRERPFVFAKWMVRRSAPRALKDELVRRLDASLRRFERDPNMASHRAAESFPFPATRILNYLTGYAYRLGSSEKEAEEVFRSLLGGLYRPA